MHCARRAWALSILSTLSTQAARTLRMAWLCGSASLLLALPAQSAPAGWYWWVSSRDADLRVCAQYMPAPHWQRAQGPFRNARCTL